MPEDPDDRAERLRARTNDLRTKNAHSRQAREWATATVAAIQGTAATGDGGIRVTVDHTGILLDLELSARVQQVPPDQLSRAITAVVRNAVRDARTQIREVYVGLQNEGVIKELPPSLPAVPPVEEATLPLPKASRKERPAAAAQPADARPATDAVPAPPAGGEPVAAPTTSANAALPAESSNPRDRRNEFLKDRSVAGYDVVPPIPEPAPRSPSDDDWYSDGFRVKGQH